jgi:hypothetical protein
MLVKRREHVQDHVAEVEYGVVYVEYDDQSVFRVKSSRYPVLFRKPFHPTLHVFSFFFFSSLP